MGGGREPAVASALSIARPYARSDYHRKISVTALAQRIVQALLVPAPRPSNETLNPETRTFDMCGLFASKVHGVQARRMRGREDTECAGKNLRRARNSARSR